MSSASTRFVEAIADLNRRIAEAEMRSTAAVGLATLVEAEADTAEAERHLSEEMDSLLILRRQLWELRRDA